MYETSASDMEAVIVSQNISRQIIYIQTDSIRLYHDFQKI